MNQQTHQNYQNQNPQLIPNSNAILIVQQPLQNPQQCQIQYQLIQNQQTIQNQNQPIQVQGKTQYIGQQTNSASDVIERPANQSVFSFYKYLINVIICGILIIILEACSGSITLEVTRPPINMRITRFVFCSLSIISALGYILLMENKNKFQDENIKNILKYLKYLPIFPLTLAIISFILLIVGTALHFNNYQLLNSYLKCGYSYSYSLYEYYDCSNVYDNFGKTNWNMNVFNEKIYDVGNPNGTWIKPSIYNVSIVLNVICYLLWLDFFICLTLQVTPLCPKKQTQSNAPQNVPAGVQPASNSISVYQNPDNVANKGQVTQENKGNNINKTRNANQASENNNNEASKLESERKDLKN